MLTEIATTRNSVIAFLGNLSNDWLTALTRRTTELIGMYREVTDRGVRHSWYQTIFASGVLACGWWLSRPATTILRTQGVENVLNWIGAGGTGFMTALGALLMPFLGVKWTTNWFKGVKEWFSYFPWLSWMYHQCYFIWCYGQLDKHCKTPSGAYDLTKDPALYTEYVAAHTDLVTLERNLKEKAEAPIIRYLPRGTFDGESKDAVIYQNGEYILPDEPPIKEAPDSMSVGQWENRYQDACEIVIGLDSLNGGVHYTYEQAAKLIHRHMVHGLHDLLEQVEEDVERASAGHTAGIGYSARADKLQERVSSNHRYGNEPARREIPMSNGKKFVGINFVKASGDSPSLVVESDDEDEVDDTLRLESQGNGVSKGESPTPTGAGEELVSEVKRLVRRGRGMVQLIDEVSDRVESKSDGPILPTRTQMGIAACVGIGVVAVTALATTLVTLAVVRNSTASTLELHGAKHKRDVVLDQQKKKKGSQKRYKMLSSGVDETAVYSFYDVFGGKHTSDDIAYLEEIEDYIQDFREAGWRDQYTEQENIDRMNEGIAGFKERYFNQQSAPAATASMCDVRGKVDALLARTATTQLVRNSDVDAFVAEGQKALKTITFMSMQGVKVAQIVNGVYRFYAIVDGREVYRGSCTSIGTRIFIATHLLQAGATTYIARNSVGIHTLDIDRFSAVDDEVGCFVVPGLVSPWRARNVKKPVRAGPVVILAYGQRNDIEAVSILGYASTSGLCVAETQEGDCGAPVINTAGEIIGLWTHGNGRGLGRFQPVGDTFLAIVASTPSRGMASPSVKVLVTQGVSRYTELFPDFKVDTRVVEPLERHPDFEPIASIPRYTAYRNTRVIDPNYASFCEEAGIDIGDLWGLAQPNEEAAYRGLFKHAKRFVPLPLDYDDVAAEIWDDMFVYHVEVHNSSIITCSDAIDKLDLTTSPGYPYNTLASTKAGVFSIVPNLPAYLEADWDRLLDPVWTVFVTNSLKEEIRPAEKLLLNKQRCIASMPLDITVHGCRFMYDFNERLQERPCEKLSAVGFCQFRGGWDRLIRFIEYYDAAFSMDEEQWDASLRSHLLWGVAYFRFRCLALAHRTPENFWRLMTLYRNVVNSLILGPRGNLYVTPFSMPSGWYGTITDNTLILEFLFRWCWRKLAPPGMDDSASFIKEVRAVFMGDDNLWSVSPSALRFFNPTTVCAELLRHGVVANPQHLSGVRARRLSFLSTDTVVVDGVCLPKADAGRMMASLAYSKSSELAKGPAISLKRAVGLLIVGWTDSNFRVFARGYIRYLYDHFGVVMSEDPEWSAVRVPTERDLEELYYGEVVRHQGVPHKKMDIKSNVTRGEMILDRLAKAEKITPAGRDFVIAAIDPMHDKQLVNLEGWPDLETAASVVRCVKQTVTFSAPPNIVGNWDCLVASWPFMEPQQFRPRERARGDTIFDGTLVLSPTATLGGVTAHAVIAGGSIQLFENLVGSIGLPATYSSGNSRVVGMGIEVINTTAEIYRQGQATVFRVPQSTPRPSVFNLTYNVTAGWGPTAFSAHIVRRPPVTQAEAMLLPGSRQWKAAEGAYLVCQFVGADNPPLMVDYLQPLVNTTSSSTELVTPAVNVTPMWFPSFIGGAANTSPPAMFYGQKLLPMHMAGVFFTGLSPQTTLSMTVNYYVETFPTPAEAEILVLATPSAPYDPVALEIMSHALVNMPVGVPAAENGLGDWFLESMESAASAIPIIGPFVKPTLRAINSFMAPQSPQSSPAPIPRVRAARERVSLAPRPRRRKAAAKKKSATRK